MDFSLNEEQRGWQMKAREFAREELRPRSLARDQIEGGLGPWDWDIITQGLEARLPHARRAEGVGRPRHRLRDAGRS